MTSWFSFTGEDRRTLAVLMLRFLPLLSPTRAARPTASRSGGSSLPIAILLFAASCLAAAAPGPGTTYEHLGAITHREIDFYVILCVDLSGLFTLLIERVVPRCVVVQG